MIYPTKSDTYWLDNDYYWDSTSSEWYWNPNKDLSIILSNPNDNRKMLVARGKYLTEIIDKIENDITSSTISKIYYKHKGEQIAVTTYPGSGKTTALRKFIINSDLKGIVATKRINDAELLYYDALAQMAYNFSLGVRMATKPDNRIFKYVNNNDLLEYNPKVGLHEYILAKFDWIICTHERLLVDPPSILYLTDPYYANILCNPELLHRSIILIDEFPSAFCKKLTDAGYANLEYLDGLVELELIKNGSEETRHRVMEEGLSQLDRLKYIDSQYREVVDYEGKKQLLIDDSSLSSKDKKNEIDRLSRQKNVSLIRLNDIPIPTNSKVTEELCQLSDYDAKAKRLRNRLGFFYDLLASKKKLYDKGEINEEVLMSYSINDFPVKTKIIFDGTSDILFSRSNSWNLLEGKGRYYQLEFIKKIHSNIVRSKTKFNELIQNYENLLNHILKDNPNEHILVYTWKSMKSDDNYPIVDKLSESNNISDKSRLHYITYQSGRERVISEYKNCTIAVILGKFMIPNDAIFELNTITNSSMNSLEYTKSLIIQFIYRTCLRVRNNTTKLKLYITDDYSDSEIKFFFSDCSNINYLKLESYNVELIDKQNDIINNLRLSNEYISSVIKDNYLIKVFSSNQLMTLLGISRSDNITRTLSRKDINYTKLNYTDKGGRGNSSDYEIRIKLK